jgi:hypothetical protein
VNINFEQRKNYLYVKLIGEYINDEVNPTLNKIFNECKSCNYSKMILDTLDIDIKPISIFDRFQIGVKIAELSTKSSLIKVGCIVRKQHFDGISVTAAENRGAQFQIFHDNNEALKWLLE